MVKLMVGIIQRRFGEARRSRPQGLENQSGTAKGKFSLVAARSNPDITGKKKDAKERPKNTLLTWRVFNHFIDSNGFIKSKEIILIV